MTEFEYALQECLQNLEQGSSNLDKCLKRYPQHARQLKPVLLTHTRLERLRADRPSLAFKARVRARLIREMRAHPPKARPFQFTVMQLAPGLVLLVLLLLVTGTVYAQSSLPGDAFYGWKLASEKAWRAASPDPVGTDLAIADRRVNELIALGNAPEDPILYARTLKAYLEVKDRLRSEVDVENKARILPLLDSHIEELSSSGILVPAPEQDIPPQPDELPLPSPTPTATPSAKEVPENDPTSPAPAATSLSVEEPAQVKPTDLPQTVPSVEIPPVEIPSLLP
jgi:hypothetical protein